MGAIRALAALHIQSYLRCRLSMELLPGSSFLSLSVSHSVSWKVYDIAAMDAAAEKYKKEKLKNEAEGYAKMGMAAASGAKGASSGLGFGC